MWVRVHLHESVPRMVVKYKCYNSAQSLHFLPVPALGREVYATYNKKGWHSVRL